MRDSDDPVEQEGVRRARERAAEADLVLWVVDAMQPDRRSAPTMSRSRNRPDVWILSQQDAIWLRIAADKL